MRPLPFLLLLASLAAVPAADPQPPTLPDLLALDPATTGLDLNGTAINDAEFPQLVRFRAIERLELNSRISEACLPTLARLTTLRALDVSNSRLGDRAMAVIVALPELRRLVIDDSAFGDAALRELPKATRLEWLAIGRETTDAGLEPLARCAALATLVCSAADLGDAAVPAIARIASLRRLVLPSPRITDAGVAALAGRTDLTGLHLSSPRITDASVPVLATLTGLTALALHGTSISEDGIARLHQALPQWTEAAVSVR